MPYAPPPTEHYAPPNDSNKPPGKPITLCYRDEVEGTGDPLLLIMGLSSQLIAWPADLVVDLVRRGFRVIRFDNRDCGLSTHLDGVPLNPIPEQLWNPPYFLSNMADDAASLLTHLGVEKAHVVGASMGGMIAQLLTLNHPTRVKSLCSIMSTTGNPMVGRPTSAAQAAVLEPVPPVPPAPPDRDVTITHLVAVQKIIGSQTHFDEEGARHHVGEAYDRKFYPEGTARQSRAILAATNRTERLGGVTVPTLVIHGREDSLIDVSGGKATAEAIPGAVFLTVGMDQAMGLAGMGHDLPAHLLPTIADAIEENAKKAGA